MISADLITQIQITSLAEKVPSALMCAIVERESSGNTWAVRYEARWSYFVDPQTYATKLGISYASERMLQQFSYGLCQVMGSVAREHGFQDHLMKLCADPALGIQFGCKKIKQLIDKYQDEDKAISAYNQGIPLTDENRNFVNAGYVNAVLEFKKQYR